ncbi:MAG: sulfotransferase [Planctomycetota bacterium]
MIFLIGSEKSGATWLQKCFSHLCMVAPDQNLHLLELYERLALHVKTYANLSDDRMPEVIRNLSAAAWRAILDGARPGIQLDMSIYPCTSTHAPLRNDLHPYAVRLMREMVPDAKFVVIVRDPRAAYCASVAYLNQFRPGWGKEIDPVEYASTWQHQNIIWLNDHPTTFVKFEDLKNEFVGTLSTVFSACGLSHSAEVLSAIVTHEYSFQSVGHPDDFMTHVKPSIVRKIEDTADNLMNFLGYQPLS